MHTYALIPAYNEEKTIGQVVRDLKQYVDQIIVVDDGSGDQTSSEAVRGGAFVLEHIINRGQGAALQTGFDFISREPPAVSRQPCVVITFDADGQFDAREIPALVAPIARGEVEVTLGSRFLGHTLSMPWVKKNFLRAAVFLTNITVGLHITDTHNGLRALDSRAIQLMHITQDRMAHGSEILSEIVRNNLSYKEIPVTVRYSAYSLRKGQKFGDYCKILFDLFVRKLIQ